jgi:hypothetical protein
MIKWLAKVTGYEEKIRKEELERAAIEKSRIIKEQYDRADRELAEAKRQGEAETKRRSDELTKKWLKEYEEIKQQKEAEAQKLFDEINKITSRPTERDISLLEQLVTRGVNQNDIEALLNITSKEFEKWKDNIEVDRIVKLRPKQDPEQFTIHHPSLAGQTEVAFEAGLIKFYRFKDEYRMPIGRYKYVYKRFKEADLRMTRETMQEYLKQIEEALNGTKKQINLSTALRLIYNMKTWLTIPFEPEAVKRLAAVTFFTEDEDLSTFDEKKGQEKIKLWERNKVHDFFSTAPIGALLNVNSSSITSLEEYLTEIQEITKALTSDLQEKS